MKSYFFVPANNKRFIRKIDHIAADYFIFDLEDAIAEKQIEDSVNNLKEVAVTSDKYVRMRFELESDFHLCAQLLAAGYENFVVPKISTLPKLATIQQFIAERTTSYRLILLIEDPQALIHLPELICLPGISGVALGSHDYCNAMGMEHLAPNFDWAGKFILNYAKAYGIEAIDVVSMNIEDKVLLQEEFLHAYSSGYDAKFFIHPNQLDIFRDIDFISENSLQDALKVRAYIRSIGGIENFGIFKLGGKAIEKPHLDRFRKILKEKNYESF